MINYQKNLSLEPIFYINEKGLVCLEEFRDVPGYEGKYQVSDLGRVKSLFRKIKRKNNTFNFVKEKILKQRLNEKGYYYVGLSNLGKSKTKKVHQLIAITFHNHIPCGYKKVINHKDVNPLNNKLSNLEIVTQRKNTDRKHLPSSSKYTGVSKWKSKWKSQIVIGKNVKYLGLFETETEASEYYENAVIAIENNTEIVVKKPKFSSKYKGVTKSKQSNKWIAQTFFNKSRITIGTFDTEEEASEAYLNKIKSLKKQNL